MIPVKGTIGLRRSTVWFALTLLWLLDAGFALYRRNTPQARLAGAVALGFLAVALWFRRREHT